MPKLRCEAEVLREVQRFAREVVKRLWEKEDLLIQLADEETISGCIVRDLGGKLDELMARLSPAERAEWEKKASDLCERLS